MLHIIHYTMSISSAYRQPSMPPPFDWNKLTLWLLSRSSCKPVAHFQVNVPVCRPSRQKLPAPDLTSLWMPAHYEMAWHTFCTIPPDPSLLHLSMCCLLRTLCLSLPCKRLPVQLCLCRFSTSFPMNFIILSIVVYQISGHVVWSFCVKLWIGDALNEIQFRWICHAPQNLA